MANTTHTLYSSTTCNRCRLAKGSMDRAGATHREVLLDLPEHEHELADLKVELGKAPHEMIDLPVIRTPDGRLLRGLAEISTEFRK